MHPQRYETWKPSPIAKSRLAKRRSRFISKIDATPLGAVYVGILWCLTPVGPVLDLPTHAVDLVRSGHAVPMPGALRDDATIVGLTRDGSIFVGNRQVQLADLAGQVSASLSRGSQRKICLEADARARYGDVKAVIESRKRTGMESISLLTY